MSGRRFPILIFLALVAVVGFIAANRARQPRVSLPAAVTQAALDEAIAASWASADADWQARLRQDDTQRQCTEARNKPAADVAAAIQARERARIVYPADGKLIGDWTRGQALAESGYGGRFTDTAKTKPNGGNCYACHQLAPAEISYGTLGPSLTGYGRAHADAARAVYDKIFDSNGVLACSQMPRFGAAGVLTPAQIADLVAYVVAPDSPVNR